MTLKILAIFLTSLALFEANAAPRPDVHQFQLGPHRLRSGQTLAKLKVRVHTLGKLRLSASGEAENAILLMHTTGGSGRQFLNPAYSAAVFQAGGVFDAEKYFIILPDLLGHGESSKPSDGLKLKFPKYEYDDLVDMVYRLLTEKMNVKRLKLAAGCSLGGMLAWRIGQLHPRFAEGLISFSAVPETSKGRTLAQRYSIVDAIRNDPAWAKGEYSRQPPGLRTALGITYWLYRGAGQILREAGTPEKLRAGSEAWIERQLALGADANDLIYQYESSRTFAPEADHGAIKVPVLAINAEDDLTIAREMRGLENAVAKVPTAKMLVVPAGYGHMAQFTPHLWLSEVRAFLSGLKAGSAAR